VLRWTYPDGESARTGREHAPHLGDRHTAKREAAVALLGGSAHQTTGHAGCTVSLQRRKRAEKIFGCLKPIGLPRKVKLHSLQRVGWLFTFATTVYNLVRMHNLVEASI
jgi:hypothetical protein